MRVVFQELEIERFKCFVARQVIGLAGRGAGLHFVRGRNEVEPRLGSNGSGKSSLWDALCWCLYGRTVGGLRNPDITPRTGKRGTTRVSVAAEVGGKLLSIVRTTNPNSLQVNGKTVGQEQIDSMIGLSFETFCHTVLLGQGRPLFLDMAPRDKLQLFSDVLNLDKWERRAAAASERASALTNRQAQTVGEISAAEASLPGWIKQRDLALSQSRAWEKERAKRIEQGEAELEVLRAQVATLEEREAEIAPRLDWAETQLKVIASDLEKVQSATIQLTSEIEQLEKSRARARKELKAFINTSSRVCPTCGQRLSKDAARHVEKRATELTEEIDEAGRKLVSLRKKEKKALHSVTALTKSRDKHRKQAEECESELRSIQKTLADSRAKLTVLEQTFAQSEEEVNPYSEQYRAAKKQVAKINAKLKELNAAHAKLGRMAERAAFWSRGFKDLRLFIIEEVLTELELNTNAALEDVGLLGWQVKYDVERENKSGGTTRGLNVTILSPGMTTPVKWESWSGGEGQRLRLVGSLALSETLLNYADVQPSLEILDEPTQHLSAEGVRDLCDYLSSRSLALDRQTFYVDHQSVESTRFASVLTVVKEKKGAIVDAS